MTKSSPYDSEYTGVLAVLAAVVGALILIFLFTNIWNTEGVISAPFSWQRILCLLAAVLYGAAIGWFIYPWRPRMSDLVAMAEDMERTHPDSLKFLRRPEGEPPVN